MRGQVVEDFKQVCGSCVGFFLCILHCLHCLFLHFLSPHSLFIGYILRARYPWGKGRVGHWSWFKGCFYLVYKILLFIELLIAFSEQLL
jgi:hypothetical protein